MQTNSSHFTPDWLSGLRYERLKSKKSAPFIRNHSSATDTEEKVTKFLISRSLASEYLPVGRQGIPNDYSGINLVVDFRNKQPDYNKKFTSNMLEMRNSGSE